MKRERNAQKHLIELYSYLDGEMDETSELFKRYKKKFSDRIYNGPYEWDEYYGLFKVSNGRIAIDPKRMDKTTHMLSNKQMKVMGNRRTTFYHPTKQNRYDFYVNLFADTINDIIRDFKNSYMPIVDKSFDELGKWEPMTIGDSFNFQCGIIDPDEASMEANMKNIMKELSVKRNQYTLLTNMLAQYFHGAVSRIEALSVRIYTILNPKMKKWSRDKLYDNINTKGISSRDLPSFKYHDELYKIWNFIKHNNMDTYSSLKRDYPDALIEDKYESGKLALYYVKLNSKLIVQLLEGTKQYFIEWCELNLNEEYSRAQWDYNQYFTEIVSDEIESIRNPLGLMF